MKYRVIESRTSDYPHPVIIPKGAQIRLGEIYPSKQWQHWIRCEYAHKSGWIPLQIVRRQNQHAGIALEDYTANELNIDTGDILIGLREMNGWIFGYKEDQPSNLGWVPKENVREIAP